MKKYTNDDFRDEIERAIKSYEENKPYHIFSLDDIANKIDWCWKWRKITKTQMENFADRVTALYDEGRH